MNTYRQHADGVLIAYAVYGSILYLLITGHQAFFTDEALTNIAMTTLENIDAFESGSGTMHQVVYDNQK